MPHTPGPWRVGETRHQYDLLIRNLDNDPVASCYLAGYGPQTGQANARLIAAAPELYEELEHALAFLRSVEWTDSTSETNAADLRHAIEAALAHAGGRT